MSWFRNRIVVNELELSAKFRHSGYCLYLRDTHCQKRKTVLYGFKVKADLAKTKVVAVE
jgi:hypothetical protein